MPEIPPPTASHLLFRLPTPADASGLQPVLDDPVVRKAMGWASQHTDARQWITAQVARHEAPGPFQLTSEFYPFVIVRRADGALVGFAQVLIAFENHTVLTGELRSLFFADRHRGHGYGSEVLEALIRWAFDSVTIEAYAQRGTLRQVMAVCNPDNTAAIRLLSKYLNDEGLIDSNPNEQGEVKPVRRFRLTRDQYESQPPSHHQRGGGSSRDTAAGE